VTLTRRGRPAADAAAASTRGSSTGDSASLTYVYCLVRSARRPSLRGAPDSIAPGCQVRLLEAGAGLWAVVSRVPARQFDEAALASGLQNLDWVGRRAIAHEAVVEHFMSAPAILPMQLFTLFTTDDRALQHVRRERRSIERILSRLEHQLEFGVRVTFDEAAARDAARARLAKASARPSRADGSRGASYLARKRDQLAADRVQLADARSRADALYATLSGDATAAERRTATDQAAP
jgi:Gas vesicle synthesis protein GvpL/GvpF